jgi:tetratricopeptide (TPR) repeat protein
MTNKNELLGQSDRWERKGSPDLIFKRCILFLIVYVLVPLIVCSEASSEDIDPTHLLEATLVPNSQDINVSNTMEHSNALFRIWRLPIQIAERPSGQWQARNTRNIAMNFVAKVDKKKSQLLIAQSPTTDLGRQLWRDRMTNPKDEKTGKGKDELQQLIKKINAIKFKSQAQTPKPLIVVEPVQKTELNKISSDIEIPQKQETAKPERELSHEQISADTLQILKDLSQHPDQLQNPFELAEILFNRNCLKEAAKCYQEALSCLNKEQTEQTDRFDNKAWLLFQIGNCLRSTDRPEALKMYKRLMVEYPDSPWVDLAKAESELVEWYLKDKPDALIKQYKL